MSFVDATSMLAQARGGGDDLACKEVPTDLGSFANAFDFIFHERESLTGGTCVGGPGELFDLAMSHLGVSLVAVVVAVVLSVPVGLWLGHIRRGEFVAVSVSNVGRAVPSLALLAFFVAFLGVGFTNVVAVLTLLAIPPILTNTYVGVRQVNPEVVDAARGVGLTEMQIVWKVELPLAIATIFSGIRLGAVAVVATATIAPLANVRTLGNPIIEPANYGSAGQLGAAILVALITLLVDVGLALLQRAVTPSGIAVEGQRPKTKRFSLPIPSRTEST